MDSELDLTAVLAGVSTALAPLRALLGDESWRVPEADLVAGLGAVARARGALEAAHLAILREVDARGVTGSVGSSPLASTAERLVRETTGATPAAARRDVAAARATAPGEVLAPFLDRLAEGRVTRGHVDVAVRCLDRLPDHLTGKEGARRIVRDFLLTVDDSAADARTLDRYARQVLARLADQGEGARDPDAEQRRFLDFATDATGMLVGQFQLDPVAGAAFRAAIAAQSAPQPAVDHEGRPQRDPRTPRQRRADALTTLVEQAAGVAVPRRGERPRVVVHATPEQLAGAGGAGSATTEVGEVLPSWVTGRLACDAVLQRVVEDSDRPSLGPLEVGREHRLVTLAQRRALAARDRGCVICEAEPDWCDAHHVVPWAQGGATDLQNLVLLCPSHHTAVHAGSWRLDRDDGGALTMIPPTWVDPLRRPRRPVQHVVADAVMEMTSWTREPVGVLDGVTAASCPGPRPARAPGCGDSRPVSAPSAAARRLSSGKDAADGNERHEHGVQRQIQHAQIPETQADDGVNMADLLPILSQGEADVSQDDCSNGEWCRPPAEEQPYP
ncbi:MAG: DUF222 domain-containing protein [Kineosporiaceae bacterium]